MSTVVVIGCTPDPTYSFPLPLGMLLWRHLVGYEPQAFLIGDEAEWKTRAPSTLVALDIHGLTKTFVPRIEGYSDVAHAKHVRQHAAIFFHDETWIMPSDADLWPLQRDYFHQHEDTRAKAVLYYANGDNWKGRDETLALYERRVRFPTLPMCHTVMRAREWKSAWGLGSDLRDSMRRTFETERVCDGSSAPAGETASGWLWWMTSDQRVSTARLCQQPWFPLEAKFMFRRPGPLGPPANRLDRAQARWPETWTESPSRYVDAHLPHDPWSAKSWPALAALMSALLPQYTDWMHRYHESARIEQ